MVTESNCLTNTWHPSKEVTLNKSDEIKTEERKHFKVAQIRNKKLVGTGNNLLFINY